MHNKTVSRSLLCSKEIKREREKKNDIFSFHLVRAYIAFTAAPKTIILHLLSRLVLDTRIGSSCILRYNIEIFETFSLKNYY